MSFGRVHGNRYTSQCRDRSHRHNNTEQKTKVPALIIGMEEKYEEGFMCGPENGMLRAAVCTYNDSKGQTYENMTSWASSNALL
jgi:hypothetical protein